MTTYAEMQPAWLEMGNDDKLLIGYDQFVREAIEWLSVEATIQITHTLKYPHGPHDWEWIVAGDEWTVKGDDLAGALCQAVMAVSAIEEAKPE